MIPSKPEKSSRRSSILKLPKARQPFQTVESNGLSMEDSPMKLKRRVSFAEKKHVKEFSDWAEQGTVWDSTYEENDFSPTKMNPPTVTNDNSRIQVLSELSNVLNYQMSSHESADDNYQHQHHQQHQSKKVLIRQNAIDLDYLPIEARCSGLEIGDIGQEIIAANPELLANKENIPAVLKLSRIESSLIESEELTVERNSNYPRDFQIYCDDNTEEECNDNNSLNKTDHQDISMDCTLPATDSILSSHIDNTMVNGPRELSNLSELTEKTRVFHENAMEITEPVGTILSSTVKGVQDKLSLFHNKSMETQDLVAISYFTMQQSNMRMNDSMEMTQAVPPSSTILTNYHQIANDRTQYFHNKSMEMTEAMVSRRSGQLIEDGTRIFHDKSMEITEAVSSTRSGLLSENRTQIFPNKSMEMTEAVASTPFLRCPRRFPDDNTKYFNNKSMEMTEVVPSIRSELYSANRTQVFHNKSMEMTENVPSTCPESLSTNRTQFFVNKSMEMTAAISNPRPEQLFGNKTQVFENNPMEMTEVLPLFPSHSNHFPEDKRQSFHTESMEITDAIIPHQKSIANTPNPAEIFTNYCMEHTAPIPSLKRQYQQIANENMQFDDGMASPNAKNVRNHSTTEDRQILEKDLHVLHRLLHQNLNESAKKSTSSVSNSPNNHNQSMEMTVPVPSHFIQPPNINQEKSCIQNMSMEMTEAIPSCFTIRNQMIDFENGELAAHEIEQIHADNAHDRSNHIIVPEPLHQIATSNGNFNDSMEQLRFRASSVSKLMNDDVTFNFTAPICVRNDNDQITNDLEDVEAPSFVYADISDDIAVLETQEREKQEEEEYEVLIPEISITEECNQFDDRRRTYVINRDIHEENKEMSGSKADETNENIGNTLNETTDDTCLEEIDNNVRVLRETKLHKEATVDDENNRSIGGKRTFEGDKDEEDLELSSSSASIAKQLSQTNTIERNNISPVKIINLKFPSVEENDLIIARIEKQQRIMTAVAAAVAEKNSVRLVDNQMELESAVVSTVSMAGNNIRDRYDILVEQLNRMAGEHNCIWKVNSATRNIISIEYHMTALLLGIVFNVPEHPNELEIIDRVRIVPRIADEETAILRMTDRLIVQKIDVESLSRNYKTYDDVLHLIEYVTNEVNSIFDFYHELKRLKCLYSMVIGVDKVSFRVWTKQMNIILNISINIKPFVDIQPTDIDVSCLLGSVRTNDIKDLIKNIKRNYKFLTFYINDIKDFIELMEESTSSRK